MASPARRSNQGNEAPGDIRKSERMELRVTPAVRDAIQRASALSGLSAGDVAYQGARQILDEFEVWHITGADRDALVEALLNPPPPNEALLSAARRYREMVEHGELVSEG